MLHDSIDKYNPFEQIRLITYNFRLTIGKTTGIHAKDMDASFIYRYTYKGAQKSDKNWRWVTGKDLNFIVDLNEFVENTDSAFRYMDKTDTPRLFYNDKNKAVDVRQYQRNYKDYMYGLVGSFMAAKVVFSSNDDTLCEGIIMVNSYGKKFLDNSPEHTEEELKHCVLNTYDYTEWTTLKGLYDGRVKMIIPPTHQSIDYNNGLLLYGDALGEDFYKFCFGSKMVGLFDEPYKEQSKLLSKWLKDDKMTIIMLENPPFVEPQGGASKGKATFKIKDKYMYQVMGKEQFETKNVNRATENLFIWSAFKFFLRQPTDSYILFSPIKYWKSQHIIDKKFIRGYVCNREHFNASEGGILLIEWANIDSNNEELPVDSDLGKRTIKKIHNNPLPLMKDSDGENIIAYLFNLSNIPKNDNGKIVNILNPNYIKVQKPYKLCEDNIMSQLPLWLANCYDAADYTEKEVIMKTSDLGDKYLKDEEFLLDSFIWSGLSDKNKCISNEDVRNEFCFGQDTLADKILTNYKLNNQHKELYSLKQIK